MFKSRFSLSALCAVAVLTVASTAEAAVGLTSYYFSGIGSGVYHRTSGDIPFTDRYFNIGATGSVTSLQILPGEGRTIDSIGVTSVLIFPIGSGYVDTGPGPNPVVFTGEGPNAGQVGIGRIGPSGFQPLVSVHGAGLVGYDGWSALAHTPVDYDFTPTFSLSYPNGDSVTFTEIEQGDFLAIRVPEPSGWALMFVGVGLAGVGLRRRRGLALEGV